MIRKLLVFLLLLGFWTHSAFSQTAPSAPEPRKPTVDDLLEETQLRVHGGEYAGLVWWIPLEFWSMSSGSTNAKLESVMKEYTIVAVVIGKVGQFGAMTFPTSTDLNSNIVLVDRNGKEHKPLSKVSPEFESFRLILQPVFKNMLGQLGENIVVLAFPGVDEKGNRLDDPHTRGSLMVVVSNLAGAPETKFKWELPLTSVSPLKFCPVGKEQVKANWAYCPWHGNKL